MRHSAGGGLRARQAARHGLRDDHRPRHDRRRARDRRPAGRLHLRGADRGLQGRGPGRARPLPGHHARRPRLAPGSQRRRRGLRRVPARQLDRLRAGASLLRRGGSPHPAPPSPARAALPGVGDAQRLARQGAEHAGRHLHRDPRGNRRGRVGRSRGSGHRPHVHGDGAGVHPRRVSTAHPPRRGRRARRPGQRREVGALRDGPRGALARPRRGAERAGPQGGAHDDRAGDEPGRPARGRAGLRAGPRRRAGAAQRLAGERGPRPRRARAHRLHAGRRLQPRRPLPPRAAPPRAGAEPGGGADAGGGGRPGRLRRRGPGALRRLHPGRALRAGRRLPRAREAEAHPPRGRAAPGRAGRRRRGRHARCDPHARRAARPRRATASRSR